MPPSASVHGMIQPSNTNPGQELSFFALTTILVITKIVSMSDVLQAINTPRRREILRTIWDRERTVGEICKQNSDITWGAISQHLRVLENAGLVSKRQDGLFRYYKAKPQEFGFLRQWLESMWDDALYRLKIQAELKQARRGPRKRNKRRKGR